MPLLHDVVENLIHGTTIMYHLIIGIVRALLPKGVLPRKSVKGETVLVTGAGSGIGKIMAIEFAKLGANLVLWDINDKGNHETAQEVRRFGVKVLTHQIDLSKKDQIAKKAQAVKDELGHVDILINNAGVVSGNVLLECSDEQIERTMAVNTTSHFWTTRAFLPSMMERNHGHIVTVASIVGKVGGIKLVDYCTSKHGAVGFHESLTAELAYLGKDGIHTTVVCPWFIDTGLFNGFQARKSILLPPLTPEYVVECTMEAILTNTNTIEIPKFAYCLAAGNQILPSKVINLIGYVIVGNNYMDNFLGRSVSSTNLINGSASFEN